MPIASLLVLALLAGEIDPALEKRFPVESAARSGEAAGARRLELEALDRKPRLVLPAPSTATPDEIRRATGLAGRFASWRQVGEADQHAAWSARLAYDFKIGLGPAARAYLADLVAMDRAIEWRGFNSGFYLKERTVVEDRDRTKVEYRGIWHVKDDNGGGAWTHERRVQLIVIAGAREIAIFGWTSRSHLRR